MDVIPIALAVACLSSPPDTPLIANQQAMHGALAASAHGAGPALGNPGPREGDYLKNADDFAADLKVLQGRFAELRYAPHVSELERFPGADLLHEMLRFNHSFHDHVKDRMAFDTIHEDELRATLLETEELRRIYNAVLDARCDHYHVTYRRQLLAKLRDMVGYQAFYTGCLPPHVPVWRIPEGR